jgi:hypothetical protein
MTSQLPLSNLAEPGMSFEPRRHPLILNFGSYAAEMLLPDTFQPVSEKAENVIPSSQIRLVAQAASPLFPSRRFSVYISPISLHLHPADWAASVLHEAGEDYVTCERFLQDGEEWGKFYSLKEQSGSLRIAVSFAAGNSSEYWLFVDSERIASANAEQLVRPIQYPVAKFNSIIPRDTWEGRQPLNDRMIYRWRLPLGWQVTPVDARIPNISILRFSGVDEGQPFGYAFALGSTAGGSSVVVRESMLVALASYLQGSGFQIGTFGSWQRRSGSVESKALWKQAAAERDGHELTLSVRLVASIGRPALLGMLTFPRKDRRLWWEACQRAVDMLEDTFGLDER